MGYKFDEYLRDAGQWEIAPKVFWVLKYKPNWRTRFMSRVFLGWIWTDKTY